MLHFSVFVDDLTNITTILLKLMFYLSGIFYSISYTVPKPYNDILLNINPIAMLIDSLRKAFISGEFINWILIATWLFIAIALSIIGIKTIQKYENSYAKVTK